MRRDESTDAEITSRAIKNGLTPRALDQMVRSHVAEKAIASAHGLSLAQLKMIAQRWQLAHLLGREKSNVTIVRSCNER